MHRERRLWGGLGNKMALTPRQDCVDEMIFRVAIKHYRWIIQTS